MSPRILLTAGTLVFALGCYALMLKGWRSRQRRQVDLPAPAVAAILADELISAEGLFVGTTSEGQWMDRIAVHQLSDRATGTMVLAQDGVHVERDDLPELFVPLADLRGASIERGLAGKVVSDGMLVITWKLGDRLLDSGFRSNDHADNARLRDALNALLPLEVS